MEAKHDSSVVRFRAAIEIRGVNPYVLVRAEIAKLLKPDWRRPMPVRVQINGKPNPPWGINMMPVGYGSFYLYLHNAVRSASATAVGDCVEISVAFDECYRRGPTHKMPRAFAKQLRATPTAYAAWKELPPSRKKEILRHLAMLKSEDAKARNIERAVRVLSGAPERFLARSWNVVPLGTSARQR
ncbi:YdeI/OmpD-associated family protein [Mesorhizobium huakuii]|uniref:YdeI/OmpD-associated family protein n=1 Tax=Mesorhizobium huakuii TaxID=28104 RepID=A0ABZ0VMM8_9HYPH|nr:YdeI/OmpD-associated family protein [Mesorhizobium huakuii]WQB98513.1 YdeI/OmpD-associated family protein [Mesorhizobium huakuii]